MSLSEIDNVANNSEMEIESYDDMESPYDNVDLPYQEYEIDNLEIENIYNNMDDPYDNVELPTQVDEEDEVEEEDNNNDLIAQIIDLLNIVVDINECSSC